MTWFDEVKIELNQLCVISTINTLLLHTKFKKIEFRR